MPKTLAGRLVPAAFIALFVSMGLGVALAASDRDAGVPAFVVPEIRLGDAAHYHMERHGPEPLSGNFTARWVPGERLLLADGRWHSVEALEQTIPTDTDSQLALELGYEAGTHRIQTIGISGESTQDLGGDGILPLTQQSGRQDLGLQFVKYVGHGELPDCLFSGLLGGQEMRADQGLKLPVCAMMGLGLGLAAVDQLEPMGVETVNGLAALRFQASWTEGDEDGTTYSPSLDAWFSPGVAYPVQIKVMEDSSGVFAEAWTATWTMTGFEQGEELRVKVPTAPAPPAPEWRTSAGGRIPVSDVDLVHPFPLSKAFTAAEQNKEVQEFLDAHPDAYVVSAEFREIDFVGLTRRSWQMTLGEPGADLSVSATQDFPTAAATTPSMGADLVAPVSITVGVAGGGEGVLPRTSIPPLPTADSLLERWAWQRRDHGTGQCWGFDLADAGSFVTEGGISLFAGRCFAAVAFSVDGSSVNQQGTLDIDQVVFAGNGTTFGLVRMAATSWISTGPSVLAAPSGEEGRFLASSPSPWVPTPTQAAGATLLGLLLGALYWLWPKLKAGATVGLFSRISGQDLLEHPARAQLVQIVQAEPGVHFQDLVRRSGLPNGTVVHHLGKLSKGGLICVRSLGRYTCYFPGASPHASALSTAPILRSEGARRVYEAIKGRPGLSGLELADIVGLQPSTVNYHVQRLVDCGLVLSTRDGRSVRLATAASAA